MIDHPFIVALRPGQWSKNFFCLAAPAFVAPTLGLDDWFNVMLVFVAFCALASAVYLFNDFCNIQEDKAHPVKSLRPIAQGAISAQFGYPIAAMLVTIGLLILTNVGFKPFLIGLGYVLLHAIYSLRVRDIPVLDLLFLATGFAFRVLAGAKAVAIPWGWPLLLTTYGLSLLLGLGKRKAELNWDSSVHSVTRPVLKYYNNSKIHFILLLVAVFTVVSYYWLGHKHLPPLHLIGSLVAVVLGIGRYLFVIFRLDGGERPERLLYSDIWITSAIISWGGVFVHAVYG